VGELKLADVCINVFMARRELFDWARWDDRMKLAEHLDFFLSVKKNYPCRVATSPIKNYHQRPVVVDLYKEFRGRANDFWQFYIEKWGIDALDSSAYWDRDGIWKIPVREVRTVDETVMIKNPPITIMDTPQPKAPVIDEVVKPKVLAFDILKEACGLLGPSCVLLEKSCLSLVRKNLEAQDEFVIGLLHDDKYNILLDNGFKKVSGGVKKNNTYIAIRPIEGLNFKTRIGDVENNFLIPAPVVGYLRRLYGSSVI
jgi:hypothetical protein